MELVPTLYAGTTFRDQIVAAWAFFFDTLGVIYHYKPETFQGVPVSRYSPDFWLPDQDSWVVVVAEQVPFFDEENDLVNLHRVTSKDVLLFTGFPAVNTFVSDSESAYVREICNFGIDFVGEGHPTECLPFPGRTLNEKMQHVLQMINPSTGNDTFRVNTARLTDAATRSNDFFRDELRPLSDFTARRPTDNPD